jgi:hypothetical protein
LGEVGDVFSTDILIGSAFVGELILYVAVYAEEVSLDFGLVAEDFSVGCGENRIEVER